jgi:deferrochelatase/peroxidase EfeB
MGRQCMHKVHGCKNVAWKEEGYRGIQDREIQVFVFGFEGMTSDEIISETKILWVREVKRSSSIAQW